MRTQVCFHKLVLALTPDERQIMAYLLVNRELPSYLLSEKSETKFLQRLMDARIVGKVKLDAPERYDPEPIMNALRYGIPMSMLGTGARYPASILSVK